MALGLNDLKPARAKKSAAPSIPLPIVDAAPVPPVLPAHVPRQQRPWEGEEELITRTARAQSAVHKARQISERNQVQAEELVSRSRLPELPYLEEEDPALGRPPRPWDGWENKRQGMMEQIKNFFLDA